MSDPTPAPTSPNYRLRTAVGLALMAGGGLVFAYAVVHTVRAGGAPGWPLTIGFLVPLVLGALLAFTDEVGPTLRAALDRLTFTKSA